MKKKKISQIIISLIFLFISYFVVGYVGDDYNFISDIINEFNKDTSETQPASVNRKVNLVGDLNVYYVDVGQADCILLENKDKYMLIDAGNNEDGQKIVNYFKSLDIEKFDFVVGTHAHEDHIGGMDDIIKNFDIDTFYMPDVITTTKTFEEVIEALEVKQIAFETPEIDSTFEFADCSVKVIFVGEDESELNNTSIVLKVTYGTNSFLFTGDAEKKVEEEIINKDIKADVLKVGHHGSQYSTSLNFLNKVNPKYAVIQVGKNNTYDHPKEVILNRLNKNKVKIYRTDESGTIIATSDGENITFSTEVTDTNG